MTQIVVTVPNDEVNFLTSLAQKMGWKYRTGTNALDRFIESCPKDINISDEEIQEEVNAVRYSK